mgnify:CR=1 FL=1
MRAPILLPTPLALGFARGGFFCRKLIMLITIANVPLTHAQMLQMASNLFTVSPPFIVYIIPRYAVVVNAFL